MNTPDRIDTADMNPDAMALADRAPQGHRGELPWRGTADKNPHVLAEQGHHVVRRQAILDSEKGTGTGRQDHRQPPEG